MSDSAKGTPCRNGNWFTEQMPSFIWVVNGERMDGKNMISLDYPDIEGGCFPCTLQFGDFGPARREISDATGVDRYNIQGGNSIEKFWLEFWLEKPLEIP